jgi:hypothetical protein
MNGNVIDNFFVFMLQADESDLERSDNRHVMRQDP